MGHQRQPQPGACLKNAAQRLVPVYQHIARRSTHKQFDAGYAVTVEPLKELYIGSGGPREETVVDQTAALGQPEFIFKGLYRGGLRHGVGHVKVGGHSPTRCRTALAGNIGLVCESRLTKMHMLIDDTRHYKTPRGIHFVVVDATGRVVALIDMGDSVVFYYY